MSPSAELAAVILARTVADAINPDRPGHTASIGNALLQPLMLRVVRLLADDGYYLASFSDDVSAA